MYRGTTPTIPIRIKGIDLTGAKLFLTFQNALGKKLTLECPGDFSVEMDGNDTVGQVTLTQEQTLQLSAKKHSVQVRWVDAHGTAGATKIQEICVKDILLDGVISYE